MSGDRCDHHELNGDVPCCRGLVARCGREAADGDCRMDVGVYEKSLQYCLPCGDGICEKPENRCACPEDCGPLEPEP
jgi:hypothetical protein